MKNQPMTPLDKFIESVEDLVNRIFININWLLIGGYLFGGIDVLTMLLWVAIVTISAVLINAFIVDTQWFRSKVIMYAWRKYLDKQARKHKDEINARQ